jgi:hypothetical protein
MNSSIFDCILLERELVKYKKQSEQDAIKIQDLQCQIKDLQDLQNQDPKSCCIKLNHLIKLYDKHVFQGKF